MTKLRRFFSYALMAFSGLVVVGLVAAFVLPDRDAPNQMNYERCLNRAADKAQGTASIFNQLRSAQCDKLKPQMSPHVGMFDDLTPKVPTGSDEKHRFRGLSDAEVFLDSPMKQVADPELIRKLNGSDGARVFHGYACKDDCSGHSAGYRWAERNQIDDEDGCTGKSQSFIEGCLAYVEEQQ